jgi:putative ATPase subunit of terminase (gpP-like)
MEVRRNDNDLSFLLMRFNQRDSSAFAKIYTKLFMELHVYAIRFYCNTSDSAEDAVQEAFCYLWERQDVVFDSLAKIKAFLFVAIKNRFKNRLSHLGVEQKYKDVLEREYGFSEEIVESELATSLLEYVERMPDPGGKVMRLYLNGYEAEEIADRLHMSIRTVYNTKSRAIGMLKKFFSLS